MSNTHPASARLTASLAAVGHVINGAVQDTLCKRDTRSALGKGGDGEK